MTRIIRDRESRILPEGVHQVVIAKIDEVSHPADPERTHMQVELVAIRPNTGTKKYVRFWTPPTLHEKDRLKPLAEAAYGRNLNREEVRKGIDIDSLIDLPLVIEIKEVIGRSGRHISKVVKMMPVTARKV